VVGVDFLRGRAVAACAARGLLRCAVVFAGEDFAGVPRARFAAFAGLAGVRARELFCAGVFDIGALPVRAPIFFFAAPRTLLGALFFPTLPAIAFSTFANRKVFLCMRRTIDATSRIVQCT
jgi:hypothetical protein